MYQGIIQDSVANSNFKSKVTAKRGREPLRDSLYSNHQGDSCALVSHKSWLRQQYHLPSPIFETSRRPGQEINLIIACSLYYLLNLTTIQHAHVEYSTRFAYIQVKQLFTFPLQLQLIAFVHYIRMHDPKLFWLKGVNVQIALYTKSKCWSLTWPITASSNRWKSGNQDQLQAEITRTHIN